MIKNTPYFRKALELVDEDKTIPNSYQIDLSEYYSTQHAIIRTNNDAWILGDAYYEALDREERSLVENVFDKDKPVAMFLIQQVMLDEKLIEKKTFSSKKERLVWLKENSNLMKGRTKKKFKFPVIGSLAGLGAGSMPAGILVLNSAIAVSNSLYVVAATVVAGLGAGLFFNTPPLTVEQPDTDIYVLTEKGHRVLETNNEVVEISHGTAELEYFDLSSGAEKVNG